MKLKAKKDNIGNIIKIKLDENTSGVARVIGDSFIEFYDILLADAQSDINLTMLDNSKVIFTLSVHKSWVKNPGWELTGTDTDNIPRPPRQFMQNIANANDIKIVDPSGGIIPTTKEEVLSEGLERVAVWEVNHIEDRLRDYFAGKPNIWLEHLKIK